jgi:hypothetical protein
VLENGVVLAMKHKVLSPCLNLLVSLVEVCFDLNSTSSPRSTPIPGSQVASGLLNPFARADLLEKKGDAAVLQSSGPTNRSPDAINAH